MPDDAINLDPPEPRLPATPDSPEQHVVGACLLDDGTTLDAAISAGLSATDFSDRACATIYGRLVRMRHAGTPIGLDTLTQELGKRELVQVGGIPHLIELTDPARVPTTARAAYFIQRVLDDSARRRFAQVSRELAERADRGEDIQGLRDSAATLGPRPDGPATLTARPLPDFHLPGPSDQSILIGNRWLCRGDIGILASTSSMGKSSLSVQMAVHWALGESLFGGFTPNGALRTLIIQSEDGDGDIAEVWLSMQHAMHLTDAQLATVRERVLIVTDRIHRGPSFRAELKRQITLHKPDIVIINPLLAFIGGDVNDSTDVGSFLREQLNSLNEPPTFAYLIVHHTAKPPKEKAKRQWNEVMYEMAGSADLTNAARAILCLQATDKEGVFKLIAAKRGTRAGLTHEVPGTVNPDLHFTQPTSQIVIKWSTERMVVNGHDMPVIHWERGEAQDEPITKQGGGRPALYNMEDFMRFVPETQEKAQPINQIYKKVETVSGVSRGGFKNLVFRAYKEGQLKMVERNGVGPCFYV